MISKQVAMTFYYGDPELEINRTKPTPSSPVTDPTNSSQSDTLQVKSPHIVIPAKFWYNLGNYTFSKLEREKEK